MRRKHPKDFILDILTYCFLIIAVIIAFFPIYWLIATSFKARSQVFSMPPVWFFLPTLANYERVFLHTSFPRYYFNSAIIGTCSVLLSLFFGSLTGYAFTRYKLRGKEQLAFWVLTTRMAPPVGFAIPFFLMFTNLRLIDKYPSIIITYLTFNLSFAIWMMRGIFEQVPIELEEAAMMDGCSRLGAFIKVTLPLAVPGLVVTAIFCFIVSWNEFLYALVLTRGVTKTVPVAMTEFISSFIIDWEAMSAAATVIVSPVLCFSLFIQKYLVRGLTMGAIK